YDWWAQNAHDRNAKFAHAMKGMERGGDPTEMNEMSRQEAFGLATGPVGELGVIGKGANAALSFGAPASAKEFATGLSDALFGLNNQTRAERTLLRQHLEKIPNIPQETWEKIYHYDEADAAARNEFTREFGEKVAKAKSEEDRLGLLRTAKERADKYRTARN